jgi:hypothetical protein
MRLFVFVLVLMTEVTLFSAQWYPTSAGLNDQVTSMGIYNGQLYVGGFFTTSNGVPVYRMVYWTGSAWQTNMTASSGSVDAISEFNGDLYIGGGSYMNGLSSPCIARWNGMTWSNVGSVGLDAFVYDLAVYDSELYVVGNFLTAGGTTVNKIARWDGFNWSTVGNGSGSFSTTMCLIVHENKLYMGGDFTSVDGNAAMKIACWDGTNWTSLGTGVNAPVYDMISHNGELYVCGSFTIAGGSPANYVAKWDGSSWSSLSTGMDESVSALEVYNNELYAGGSFLNAGGTAAKYIARWDGISWHAVDGGMDSHVWELKEFNGDLYAGGHFTMAGSDSAYYLARYSEFIEVPELSVKTGFRLFPNPASSTLSLESSQELDNASFMLFDGLGRKIAESSRMKGANFTFPIDHLPRGKYFLKIYQEGDSPITMQFIKI